ncbi:MAG: bifunctional folylpolyglutamate synthase/dihydrofolate synthase, partial [Methylobacterium sp.]|nr:bifunctional folylpolyglutamate synthase/dihydrofolate synthase [Methylobacterium sp.]
VALTYFEFGTLAAMWLFAQQGVDVAILEIGLGGRLDAVNIFEPACAIVTSVDLDHQEFLGQDRESIGREKAGIYRTGVPAICGEPRPPQSLVSHAAAIGADLRCVGADFSFLPHAGGAEFRSGSLRLQDLPLPALSGSFQCGNAACALEAIHVMQSRLPVEVAAIRRGLSGVRLSGRFQRFRGPPEVIVDVAHNPHAAHALAGNLRNQPGPGRTLAVFGMLADKDIAGVVNALAQDIDAWFVAGIAQPRGATAGMLEEAIRSVHPQARLHCYPEVTAALHAACLQAAENDRIIAFGSFYTVADVMRELKDSPPCNQDKN